MGRLQAEEMRDRLDTDTALRWHLSSNHYPPVRESFVPVAKEAIEKANEEAWDDTIDRPNGKTLTVAAIVEGLHLDTFLEQDDPEDLDDPDDVLQG